MAAMLFSVVAAFVGFLGAVSPASGTANYLCPVACSCLGSMVDCSKRGLKQIPADLPDWVTILELQSNEIDNIPESAFQGLTELEELDLSYNQLTEVNASVLEGLPSLKTLKLAYNQLTEIPVLDRSANLTHLILNHNEISVITSEAISILPLLHQLDLNYNHLTELVMGTFPPHPNLHELSLKYNRIQHVDVGALDNLTNLEQLNLFKNKITFLAKDTFQLKNLKILWLGRNRLRTIDGLSFSSLENLKILKLRGNLISTLMDGAFYGLSSIQYLQLDHNNLTQVTKGWLYGLGSLQRLSLGHNRISWIEPGAWEFCELLWELDLRDNKIATIGEGAFRELEHLKFLFLDRNQVSFIGDGAFIGLDHLQILDMNQNQLSWTIEDLNGAFEGLPSLNRLGLDSNRIKSVSKRAFHGLEQLKQLHLVDNAITSIQNNSFSELNALQELRLNTSSLLCDCHLAWLPHWLKNSGFQTTVTAKCAHPEWLKGKSIFEVQQDKFTCNDIAKPVFIREPDSQFVLRGANVTMQCTAASNSDSPMSCQWRKDNKLLNAADHENYATVIDGEITKFTTVLHLKNVQDTAEGKYQCIISNLLGSTYSRKAKITVHVFPTFVKTPKNANVRTGNTARLECAATGHPPPVIAWQKDGGDDFPAARGRRMHVMPTDDVFFITGVQPSDQGIYSCTATNAAGTIIANATLNVLETPAFVKPMEDKMIEEDKTIVLECMASGSPKPKLEWLKDGQPLTVTERHFFTASDQLLIIVQARPSDAGHYTCVMSNTLGTERGSSQLTVLAANPREEELSGGLDEESTTTGIIIIAVVCCVVGTSLVWVIIIYQTRKKTEEYSSTPTDETTLPGDMPSTPYRNSEKDGNSSPGGPLHPVLSTSFTKYPGLDLSGRDLNKVRTAVIFPSDIDDDDHRQSVPLTSDEQRPAETSDNSIMALHRLPRSDSDTVNSSSPSTHSTRSTHSTTVLQTFHPQPSPNHSQTLSSGRDSPCDTVAMVHATPSHNPHSRYTMVDNQWIPDGYHGSRPPDTGQGDYNLGDGVYENHPDRGRATFPRSASPVHSTSSQSLRIHRLPKDSHCSSISSSPSSYHPSATPHSLSQSNPAPVHTHHPASHNTCDHQRSTGDISPASCHHPATESARPPIPHRLTPTDTILTNGRLPNRTCQV